MSDQERLRRGLGLVRPYRVVSVVGPDARRFLHGVLSADVAALPVGASTRTLLLEPRGKLVAHGWLLAIADDRFALVVDEPVGVSTLEHLGRFCFRVDVELELGERPGVLWGPRARERAGVEPGAVVSRADGLVADLAPPRSGGPPRVLVLGPLPDEVPAVDEEAFAAVRIEAGEPVAGVDVDTTTIPQEAELVAGAVSFTKGCYLGQELVARIDSRGHVNRLLRGIVVEADGVPAVGAEVRRAGRRVGTLTSAARSDRLGAWIGLAVLRRECEPGAEVELAGEEQVLGRVAALPLS
ncbi:MAG TPA: folate-binding protein [Actinobacteria bacterium]|nr:folate-binding protein [Actinomycetota bacterium]